MGRIIYPDVCIEGEVGINSYSLNNRRARRRKSKIAGAHFSMAAGITMVLRAVKSSLAVRMKTAM
jgi:hypothetical protein